MLDYNQESKYVYYKSGYKYQLSAPIVIKVPITLVEDISTHFIDLSKDGWLVVKEGYASDGPTNPAIDTKSFMRASFVHDALYQLMRNNDLPKLYRLKADLELKRLCIEDGMWKVRAWWAYQFVRMTGDPYASPDGSRKVSKAP